MVEIRERTEKVCKFVVLSLIGLMVVFVGIDYLFFTSNSTASEPTGELIVKDIARDPVECRLLCYYDEATGTISRVDEAKLEEIVLCIIDKHRPTLLIEPTNIPYYYPGWSYPLNVTPCDCQPDCIE